VVGCMMAVTMGVAPDDEATLDRACDLGMAFQLANIARDIAEDAGAGRHYLPRQWLAEKSIAADAIMSPSHRPGLSALARRLTERAAMFEASARMGTPALSYRSAWAVLSAAAIYGAIGRKVAKRGRRAWDSRVGTGKLEKLGFMTRASVQAARRNTMRIAPRDAALWTRPR
jgi:15-cis-phytoene synthase